MDLTDPIQTSYIEEALLHARFAAGVRAIIRHKLPGMNPEPILIDALNAVAAATAGSEIPGQQTLLATVRDVVNTIISKRTSKSRQQPKKSRKHPTIDIAAMQPQKREILARFYAIRQSEAEIGYEMGKTIEAIREVKRSARNLNRT